MNWNTSKIADTKVVMYPNTNITVDISFTVVMNLNVNKTMDTILAMNLNTSMITDTTMNKRMVINPNRSKIAYVFKVGWLLFCGVC